MRCTACIYSCVQTVCRRKQYNGVRAAAQFVAPLLNSQAFLPQRSWKLEQLMRALLGAPPSLAHEGPLACCHLSAFTAFREVGDLVHLFSGGMSVDLKAQQLPLCPQVSSLHVAEMWTPLLRERYVQEKARVRVAEMMNSSPPRHEAGLTAHRVFSDISQFSSVGHCARQAEGNAEGKEENTIAGRWRRLIDKYTLMLPDRSSLHELENLPQEIGIGELISSLLLISNDNESCIQMIIDVGGGGGFLATQLGEIFMCESLVVDPFTPKHAIDNNEFPHWGLDSPRQRPRTARRYQFSRISKFFTDVDWRATSVNFDKCVFVAKHLCGTAMDSCLRHLHTIDMLPRIIVIAPCCFNKGSYDDYCNSAYISRVVGVNAKSAWNQLTRLTDWNRPYEQQQTSCGDNVTQCGGRTKSRWCRKKTMHHLLPCMEDIAFMAESVINHGRVLWLRELGYSAAAVSYVPRCVTPKNQAIVAIRDINF